MTSQEQLAKVKTSLGITDNYQDNTLLQYVNEVKEYMIDAGVDDDIVDSKEAIGVIARGVADLWNYGSGDTKLSDYFIKRVYQLRLKD